MRSVAIDLPLVWGVAESANRTKTRRSGSSVRELLPGLFITNRFYGKKVDARGGSRTRTLLRIEDFLAHYHFRDQLALFGVWAMPSPCVVLWVAGKMSALPES